MAEPASKLLLRSELLRAYSLFTAADGPPHVTRAQTDPGRPYECRSCGVFLGHQHWPHCAIGWKQERDGDG